MNIDELVVQLSLDPSKFTAGEKAALESFRKTEEEFQKRLSRLEAKNKDVAYSFGDVTHAAEGLLGALAGAGMVSFARDTMTTVAATGRMATNIGVATNELSAFGRMIERNGGNADAAMGSMKSLTDQVERFKLLGQASNEMQLFAGTIGADLNSSALEMYMKFAEWASKHRDDPKQVNVIGQLGGLDQGAINQALKGHVQVLREYQAALKGAVSPEQADAMIRMQNSWVTLDQAIEKTGRDLVTDVEPAFTSISTKTSAWIESNQTLSTTLMGILGAITALSALKPAAWLLRLLGLGGAAKAAESIPALIPKVLKGGGIGGIALSVAEMMKADSQNDNHLRTMLRHAFGIEDPNEPVPWAPRFRKNVLIGKRYATSGPAAPDSGDPYSGSGGREGGGRDSAEVREKRIRQIAAMLGIDPDVAMAVARHEGFGSFKSTIPGEQSFGDFQLNMNKGSLGDRFQKETGLDPRDPKNEAASDLYALKDVQRNGWRHLRGAANSGIGNMQGVHIDSIAVTVQTDSKSPREHGRIAADEIKNRLGSSLVTQANTGLSN